MHSTTFPIVIVGTGLAGYQLAREFRRIDTTTPLIIVTADDGRFYSKPLLSTALTGKKTSDTLATATAEAMAQQLNADIRTHATASSINPDNQSITVNHETLQYSKLVLACGADVIKPPLAGDGAADVLSINHLYHYAEFEKLIKNKKHVTILGAGLIGCEFANDLSNIGYEVHVIAPAKAPLDLLIPEKIGALLQTALEQNGVYFHLEKLPKNVEKAQEGFLITLSDGTTLATEFILSAIGLVPHTALAKTAHIQTNRGVLVDRYLETSVKNIFALGDCAEVEGHVLPYITPILNCAKALAKTLAGNITPVDYPAMPVVVKTPAHPIVICPPPRNMLGEWTIETNNHSVRALFHDEQQQLHGFVLTNDATKERATLVKLIPGLF